MAFSSLVRAVKNFSALTSHAWICDEPKERAWIPPPASWPYYPFCVEPTNNTIHRVTIRVLSSSSLEYSGLLFVKYDIVALAFVGVRPLPSIGWLFARRYFAHKRFVNPPSVGAIHNLLAFHLSNEG